MTERVAILGAHDWLDQSTVRLVVKTLPADTVVLLDDEPFDLQAAARRQCRCSSLVAVVHQLPTNVGRNAVEARRARDEVLLSSADRVIVFGHLAPDRELTLRDHERRGLPVERREVKR